MNEIENENQARSLTLTRTELMFLDDALPRGFFARNGRTETEHIIEKLCIATLRSHTSGTVKLNLMDRDLWLLRDLVRNCDWYGDEPVGLTIRSKIYDTLFQQQLTEEDTVARLLESVNLKQEEEI